MIVGPETGGRAWVFCGWPHSLCTSLPVHYPSSLQCAAWANESFL